MLSAELLAAFALDFAVGEVRGLPHPTQALRAVLKRTANLARQYVRNPFLAGLLATCATLCAAAALVAGTIFLANAFLPGLDRYARILWLYLGLTARRVDREARAVLRHLDARDSIGAGRTLARMAGRHDTALTETEIVSGTIGVVAVNTVDGVLAPAFFALIGGPILMWLFKAVAIADSMLGHRSFRSFGRFAAQLDDVANFLPARACLLLFPPAAAITGFDGAAALHVMRTDTRRNESLNAGIPEAGMAGALHARLGGMPSDSPVAPSRGPYGLQFPPPGPVQIEDALSVMWSVSLLGLIVGALLRAGLG